MLKKIRDKYYFILETHRTRQTYQSRIRELDSQMDSYRVNVKKREAEVIVSLTSFPARFPNLHYTIKSIFCQTMKPDRIILYLDDNCEEELLPDSLLELKQYGLQIEFRPGDMRPHKKYYYAMMENPDSIVITIDDDIVYPAQLIQVLYQTYRQYPGCVAAARAHKILFREDGAIKRYNEWEWESNEAYQPSMQLLATGCGGVLYPPDCMDRLLLEEPLFRRLSPAADDLWLKVMQILRKTPVVLCDQCVRRERLIVPGSQKKNLNSRNVHQNMNDVYMRALMDYFGLEMRDFLDCAGED